MVAVISFSGCQGDLSRTISQVVWEGHPFKTTGFIKGINIPYKHPGTAPVVFIQSGKLVNNPSGLTTGSPFCAFQFDRFKWERPALMKAVDVSSIPLKKHHENLGGRPWFQSITVFKIQKDYNISINTPFDLPTTIADYATAVTMTSAFKCYLLSQSGIKSEITDNLTLRDFQELLNFDFFWDAPNV